MVESVKVESVKVESVKVESVKVESDDRIRSLIMRSCLLLDDERFDDYLALWSPRGRYRITSWSPDLRKELVLLDLPLADLRQLLENVPNHERMAGTFSRHATGPLVEWPDGEDAARATSSLLVVHTDLEGVSSVYAVGKYLDDIEIAGGDARIVSREVRLETRQLGTGSHVPM